MKKGLLFLAFILLASVVFRPVEGEAASGLNKIRSEISRLKQDMNNVENNLRKVDNAKQNVAQAKTATAESINLIIEQINSVNAEMETVTAQIAATESDLLNAAQALEDTQARIESRDELLQSRMRLMYTSGFVSYMDVLFNANSFSDFLGRFDSLQSILSQDKVILGQFKSDKLLIEEKKQQVEQQLAGIQQLYRKKENYYNTLKQKEQDKEVMILQYNNQMAELEERTEDLETISAEQKAQLLQLAKKEKEEMEKRRKKKNVVYYNTGGKLALPLKDEYRLTSGFGPRVNPFTGREGSMHTGLDMAAPLGTPIYAAEAGTVILAQSWSGYGNTVIIDHGNGMWTLYAHIRQGGIKVEKGQTVKRGEKIAEVGSTGNSTGNHVHFEVRLNDQAVSPSGYL
ncbi:membrane protein [Paenibacillus darwinianus]|uniref:Membrane protein n=1 Tax=Paenibacillus darwinianus TaxID=1380763 RepID=A0A9W5S1I8_9BACL|nr:M23 family metallopeptidase [Paenibacillus darwinianus]EXX88259.1 membrane protein [Paenibacillus darwinianus]EXX88991.1 membrane protein [Paenibacillus darwinianus]EXX89384.1 membrane protein [Paenibacillus darwinianus]